MTVTKKERKSERLGRRRRSNFAGVLEIGEVRGSKQLGAAERTGLVEKTSCQLWTGLSSTKWTEEARLTHSFLKIFSSAYLNQFKKNQPPTLKTCQPDFRPRRLGRDIVAQPIVSLGIFRKVSLGECLLPLWRCVLTIQETWLWGQLQPITWEACWQSQWFSTPPSLLTLIPPCVQTDIYWESTMSLFRDHQPSGVCQVLWRDCVEEALATSKVSVLKQGAVRGGRAEMDIS